jgi:hypothetical protein
MTVIMSIDHPERLLLTRTLTEPKPSTVDHSVVHIHYSLELLKSPFPHTELQGHSWQGRLNNGVLARQGRVSYSLLSTHLGRPEKNRILNCRGELAVTNGGDVRGYASRGFYEDWWNSTSS